MGTYVREFLRSRELLVTWTLRDFKVRYSQSVLGAAWAILQPLSLMLIFSVIFSVFFKIPTGGIPYPIFAYTALLPWTFFSSAVSFAIPSLVNNMSLVSKIYFAREILPVSAILVSLIDFLIASSIYLVMMLIYRIEVRSVIIFALLAFAIQLILTLAVSLWGAAVMVFYRDVRFIVPLALQLWMYASPIIYPASVVPEQWRPFYFLNPMAVIIDTYRRVILLGELPDFLHLGLAAAVSLLGLLLAFRFFKRAERIFADII